MGCVASKLDINDVHSNIFTVLNIDQMGSRVCPGQIEITEIELVLYQKGKDPLKWPFKSLRRYGFEAEMFSFESGRRCATGPGIYAFKCRRAENLFNLLQARIRAGDNNAERGDGGSPADDPTTSRWSSSVASTTGVSAHSQVSRPSIAESSTTLNDVNLEMQPLPMYVNCDILDARQSGLHATNSSSQPNLIHSHPHPHPNLPPLTLPSTLPPLNISRVPPLHPDPDSPDTPSHQYENIAPGDVCSPGYLYSTTLHSFSLPPKPFPAPGVYNPPKPFQAPGVYNPPSPLHSPPMSPGPISPLLDLCTPLNYIMLDLDKQDSGVQQTITNNGTKRPVVGYTTIDFNKTSALIKSSNNRFEDDEPGVRKTRHNSSISDISGAFRAQLSPTD